MTYKEQLDMNRIPQHIAIIMDGNGRWAKAKGGKRGEGHIAGASALHDTMMTCGGGYGELLEPFRADSYNRYDPDRRSRLYDYGGASLKTYKT